MAKALTAAAIGCRVTVALCAVLILDACSRPTHLAPPPATTARLVPWTPYVCEDGRVIQVLYLDSRAARVKLAGEVHQMTTGVSGSGVRYVGDGLQWWSNGEEGMLAPLGVGEEIAAAPGVRCVPPAEAPVRAPRPGAPGGLPDDRAPLDERPAQEGSAQAAATVVETYYALLESGRTLEAAKLRSDGVEEDLRSLATLSAQVGRPGALEGAAGSLYVETPVVVFGRLASGEAFFKSGKVTLRRVNNVPGSTAEQRRWRIGRIELY